MILIDNLVNLSFSKSLDGKTLFYPKGKMRSAYLVDAEKEREIRSGLQKIWLRSLLCFYLPFGILFSIATSVPWVMQNRQFLLMVGAIVGGFMTLQQTSFMKKVTLTLGKEQPQTNVPKIQAGKGTMIAVILLALVVLFTIKLKTDVQKKVDARIHQLNAVPLPAASPSQ